MGKKWKFLTHQSDVLIILAIVQVSTGTFQTSTSNTFHISKSPGVTSLIWFSSWFSQVETVSVFLSLRYNLDESISRVWSNLGLWSKWFSLAMSVKRRKQVHMGYNQLGLHGWNTILLIVLILLNFFLTMDKARWNYHASPCVTFCLLYCSLYLNWRRDQDMHS